MVYCFCLRRLTQRPRLRTRMASLCRRPVLAGDSCHASGKTLGRQLTEHFFFRELAVCFFFFFFMILSRHFLLFFSFFLFLISDFVFSVGVYLERVKASLGVERVHTRKYSMVFLLFIRERD